MSDEHAAAPTLRPKHAIFRFPRIGIIAAALVMFGASPLALSHPLLALVYLLPIAVIYWIVRLRTIADDSGLKVRRLFSSRELTWPELKGLSITERAKVRAVLHDGTEVGLPTVLTRHLPIIAAVSGGRVADPTATTDDSADHGDKDGTSEQTPPSDTAGSS